MHKLFKELLSNRDCQIIFNLFNNAGQQIRFVGGCVRNILLSQPISDIDFVTTARPEISFNILKNAGVRVIKTGLKHGTITAIINQNTYEITTIRFDKLTDGRHAEVEFCNDFALDAKRRDFTINAMSVDNVGTLYDYYGGQNDLLARVIKFVGEPKARVREDYLRILRCYRFYSEYGDSIDLFTREACKEFADKILFLSEERIHQEFTKILVSKKVVQTIQLMFDDIILQKIINVSKLDLSLLKNILHFCWINNIELFYLRNFFSIIKPLDIQLKDIKWIKSTKERNYLSRLSNMPLISSTISNINLRQMLYQYGRHMLLEKAIIDLSKVNYFRSDIIDKIKSFDIPILPIRGGDVKRFGLSGIAIGQAIKKLEKKWVESDFILTKAELLSDLGKNNVI